MATEAERSAFQEVVYAMRDLMENDLRGIRPERTTISQKAYDQAMALVTGWMTYLAVQDEDDADPCPFEEQAA